MAGGKRGTATGDGFHLSSRTATDLSYEAGLRIEAGRAAGLTVRGHYTATLDTDGMVKLWRPGRDIAVVPMPVERGRTYHVRVTATGDRLRVFLDHAADPVIDAVDATYAAGAVGLNVFAGTAVLLGPHIGGPAFRTGVAGPWEPAGGTWTTAAGGLRGRHNGDGFLTSARTGADFTYEADLRVLAGRAAALTFRDGYVAAGPRLRVYADRSATAAIDVPDAATTPGRFGVNVFDGLAEFQDVTVR